MNSSPLEYLAASFELHLRAENKAPKTVGIYLASLRHFARWAERRHPELTDWTDITRVHLREWSVDTIESSSAGNASVHWRGLQQFLKWAELDCGITINPIRKRAGPDGSNTFCDGLSESLSLLSCYRGDCCRGRTVDAEARSINRSVWWAVS